MKEICEVVNGDGPFLVETVPIDNFTRTEGSDKNLSESSVRSGVDRTASRAWESSTAPQLQAVDCDPYLCSR